MFSRRSIISLGQYFSLQEIGTVELLFIKHGVLNGEPQNRYLDYAAKLRLISEILQNAEADRLESVMAEVVRSQGSFRNRVAPRYMYDERWQDVQICLSLDGYIIRDNELRRADANFEGNVAVEDDLTQELQGSGLPETENVLRLLSNSAEDFRRADPDLNGALTNARTALQTLATEISRVHHTSRPAGFDETKWGQVIAHLRTSGVITEQEEKGLSGVFTFVSPGAHTAMGFSELEMVRLGRSLVIGMCYFLAKRHNG